MGWGDEEVSKILTGLVLSQADIRASKIVTGLVLSPIVASCARQYFLSCGLI
jgi:hypothetical protein